MRIGSLYTGIGGIKLAARERMAAREAVTLPPTSGEAEITEMTTVQDIGGTPTRLRRFVLGYDDPSDDSVEGRTWIG